MAIAEARMPHGLWKVSYKQVLGFLQKEGFNAIRLPFSTAMALDLEKINTTVRAHTQLLFSFLSVSSQGVQG